MIRLYPLMSRKVASMLLSIGLFTSLALEAQPPACGPVVENFDNTGNTMAGFSSSTVNSLAPGFVYGQTGQNGYLQKCDIPSAGTVYDITTPTYQTLPSQTTVGYGFDLSGQVAVSNITVFLQYFDNDNNINTVSVANYTPTYTGSGGNISYLECSSFAISNYTGFTPGERYRFIFQLTASTGSNLNQCIVFDNFRTTGAVAQAALPVSFISFNASTNGTSIALLWNVAGEKDVNIYEVERSSNGTSFSKIGTVDATGSTAYSFTDDHPINGVSFYRIRNVDQDGRYTYTRVLRINTNKVVALRAFPQPAGADVTVEHEATRVKGTIRISGTSGQIVKNIEVTPYETQTLINLSSLRPGMYLVKFDNGEGQTQTLKLLKQ